VHRNLKEGELKTDGCAKGVTVLGQEGRSVGLKNKKKGRDNSSNKVRDRVIWQPGVWEGGEIPRTKEGVEKEKGT